jgi:peptidoglycan/LPS O-acetylase OafA/YrhL
MNYIDPLQKKQEYFGINRLRFFAAFWVLIFHASIHFGRIEAISLIQPIIDQGVLAMTLFFTLSGFVLSYRYRFFKTTEEKKAFYSARIARLYPVYILMGLITLWLVPDSFAKFDIPVKLGLIGEIVFSIVILFFFIFAIQAWFPGLFVVWNFGGSWSLSVEAFFYSLFPEIRTKITSYNDRSLCFILFIIPILMLLILVGMIISSSKNCSNSNMFYVLPVFRLPEFIFGITGFILFVERERYISVLYYSSVIFAILLFIAVMTKNLPGNIDYGWLAIFPFMGAFVYSTRISAPVSIKQIVNYLGRISYCVYMAQFFIIPVLKQYKYDFTTESLWEMTILSTLIVAVITYHLVESFFYQKAITTTRSLLNKILH